MLLQYIRAGMILRQDITDERGNLLLESGAVLNNSYLSRLKQLGFRQLQVYDPYADSLRSSPAVPAAMRQELELCIRSLMQMRLCQDTNRKIRILHCQKLDAAVKQIISHLETQLPDIINMPIRQPVEDEVSHAVNVCLFSILTGLYLRFSESVLVELAAGALLHDIGKTLISADTVYDDAYSHTIYGHDLLLTNKYSQTVARIAAEHHERPDGLGYPLGLIGKDIHPLSRIVAVANHYDNALILEQKGQLQRQNAVESMMANGNAAFDLNILRAFFHTIAIYPVGSLVKLNSGKLAYVIKNKSKMPLRPCVQLAGASGVEIDLTVQPKVVIEQLIAE